MIDRPSTPSPGLNPQFGQVVDNDRCYIERRRDRRRVAALTGTEAVALALLDGQHTVAEATGLMAQALGVDVVPGVR